MLETEVTNLSSGTREVRVQGLFLMPVVCD